MSVEFEIASEEERDTLVQAIKLRIRTWKNEDELGTAMISLLYSTNSTYPIKFRASYISHYYNVDLHLDFLQKALKEAYEFVNYNTQLASRYIQHPELIYELLERVNNAIKECWDETEENND